MPRGGDPYCIPCADPDAAGPFCQYTRGGTCNGYGTPQYDGRCACDNEFVQRTRVPYDRQCTICKTGVAGNACDKCQSTHYAPSYPACEAKCTAHATGQDSTTHACLCHAGWRGERCECFVGLDVSKAAPCLVCATITTDRVAAVNGRCAHATFVSTTTTTTTDVATTAATTTAPVTCVGSACVAARHTGRVACPSDSSMYKCCNGKCAAKRYDQDGDNDCGDNSDEDGQWAKCHREFYRAARVSLNSMCLIHIKHQLCYLLDGPDLESVTAVFCCSLALWLSCFCQDHRVCKCKNAWHSHELCCCVVCVCGAIYC